MESSRDLITREEYIEMVNIIAENARLDMVAMAELAWDKGLVDKDQNIGDLFLLMITAATIGMNQSVKSDIQVGNVSKDDIVSKSEIDPRWKSLEI